MMKSEELDTLFTDIADAIRNKENSEDLISPATFSERILDLSESGNIPAGIVCIWSGSVEEIPAGWALCDGENGTPDLRDRFVLGHGAGHDIGETGGEESVTLTIAEIPAHAHVLPVAGGNTLGSPSAYQTTNFYKAGTVNSQAQTNYTGKTGAHNNMPPYLTLCYIMKL